MSEILMNKSLKNKGRNQRILIFKRDGKKRYPR